MKKIFIIFSALIICISANADNASAPSNTTASAQAAPTDTGAGVLSTADNAARVDELQKNKDAIKAKEQSSENKLLGAAAIGATGIGGMNLASGLAEKKSDDDATRAMEAYLATIRCDYGAGQINRGGDTDIVLPGANELTLLSAEYIKLARELKTKKEALGLTPGIESELVLDKAGGGLYDNAATGKTDGAYTSVARALTNTGGTDAAEWAAQRADASGKVKTGAIVAGAGIVGGIAGNLAINSGGADGKNIFGQNVATEKSAEINAKYDALRKDLRDSLKPTENKSKNDAETPGAANDDASDKIENIEPLGVSLLKNREPTVSFPDIKIQPNTIVQVSKAPITLYNASLFASGKTNIKQPNDPLDKTIIGIKNAISDDANYKLKIIGYTDRDKINPVSALCKTDKICDNDKLSLARAESIKTYLEQQGIDVSKIEAVGMGDKCANGTVKTQKSLDRKVEFYMIWGDEEFPDINCQKQ